MEHEKAGFIAQAGLPVNLKGANSLLGGRSAPEGETPVAQFNAAFFKHRASANRVLLLAILAAPTVVQLTRSGLAVLHLVDIDRVAARAGRKTAPALQFHELNRGLLVRTCLWHT